MLRTHSPFNATLATTMNLEYVQSTEADAEILASIRVRAMRPSLEALGRYDPVVAKRRFLDKYDPRNTTKIIMAGDLVGFYVILPSQDHIYLDHLYIEPLYQGGGIGTAVLNRVKVFASEKSLPIKLGALKGSRSNSFYISQGFEKTHEEEWDIYYRWQI